MVGSDETQDSSETSKAYLQLKQTLTENNLQGSVRHRDRSGIPNLGLINLVEAPYDISKGHIIFETKENGDLLVQGGSSFLGTEAMDIDYPAWEELMVSPEGQVTKKVHATHGIASYRQFKDGEEKKYTSQESEEIISKLQRIADNAVRLKKSGELKSQSELPTR